MEANMKNSYAFRLLKSSDRFSFYDDFRTNDLGIVDEYLTAIETLKRHHSESVRKYINHVENQMYWCINEKFPEIVDYVNKLFIEGKITV